MITVKETSSEERQNEMVELFEKIRPFLEQGISYSTAYKILTGEKHNTFTRRRWWKDLLDYGKKQGFDRKYFGNERNFQTGLLGVILKWGLREGLYWQYSYCDDNNGVYTITNRDLVALRKEIEQKHLTWKVVDLELAKKNYKFNRMIAEM